MSKLILANDGIDEGGKKLLENAGFTVITEKVAQEELAKTINEKGIIALTVRSASKVRKDLIDSCPNLKVVARGGVGMDNIDVDYAKSKGIAVINTPAASSNSVAELVFAHLFSCVRFLHDSNRELPAGSKFDDLKKKYSKGSELRGKTLGIIGFGRIGQSVGKIALGCGMKIMAYDPFVKETQLEIEIAGTQSVSVKISTCSMDELLAQSDFITLHVPGGNLIGEAEISKMKNGAGILNAARGGVINEAALISALNSGKLSFAGLDVFENEPNPSETLLKHPKVSVSPHIGASTNEAQERIGIELAEKIIAALN